ncbi:MAG: N-acetylmuramoyl-L-alanine amidase, partial [bacterium]
MKRELLLMVIILSLLIVGRVDVCIDPGHGGHWPLGDPGAVNHRHGQNGPYESTFAWEIVQIMADDLYWVLGYSISMARADDDSSPTLETRVKRANGERINPYTGGKDTAECFVSVHINSSDDSTKHGTLTEYYKGIDKAFGQSVHNKMFYYISNFPWAHNFGLKKKGEYVLKHTSMPGCLTECAFISHDIAYNAQWFQLKENQGEFKNKVAWGIDNGIDAYFGYSRPKFMIIIEFGSQKASARLMWGSSPASGVTGYNLYRQTYPDSNYVLIASNIPDTTYIDNDVVPGGIYSYYVRARRSSGQESNPSEIAICQIPPFSSNNSHATGVNTGRRVIFDAEGNSYLTWTNQNALWCAISADYGTSWSAGNNMVVEGWQSSVVADSIKKLKICYISTLGVPDSAAQETLSYTVNYSYNENDFWHEEVLYETYDTILSVSFAIDPLDTGWVVFNTYDVEGNNRLKIGKFYTQTMPESLESVLTLDTYTGYGIGAIGIKSSDRSLHIVYEKSGAIMYLQRDNLGNWSTPFQVWVGKNPSLSVAGDLIHLIWERWYPSYTKIQTCYTNGKYWSRIQDIATNYDRGCFPYLEKGSIAVWEQKVEKQWEVYKSQRDEFGGWTPPQNISQTSLDSKYPQVAMYQTISSTKFVYVWTEGNTAPYEVKILPVSQFRASPVPLYAFDLGEEKSSIFNEQRTGFILYGQGFEKSVDYDTVALKYRITGLDPDKIYLLGLAFYQ